MRLDRSLPFPRRLAETSEYSPYSVGGNGIDWQAGNTLRISDSVIEGYAQYGVRAGTRRGGFGGFELANVYEEVGAVCQSTGRDRASRSYRARQRRSRFKAAKRPSELCRSSPTRERSTYRYYVVAHHPTERTVEPAATREAR